VVPEGQRPSGLRTLARIKRYGEWIDLLEVPDPAPRVWWPETVRAVSSPAIAVIAVARARDPVVDVVSSEPVEHHPGGTVSVSEEEADRIVIKVDGPGGLAVIRRAWLPLYEVTIDGEPGSLTIVDLVLSGVVVPPGAHDVVIEINQTPILVALGVSAVSFLTLLLFGFLPLRRGNGHDFRGQR